MNRLIRNEKGFTLVELLIVMILSLIMLAGMVGLVSMAFRNFNTSKSLQAMADASRRALPVMDRQMKGLLHINDTECVDNYKEDSPDGVWNGTSFYADINNSDDADVENYAETDKVEFYLDSDTNKLMQRTTDTDGNVVETSLCSYVESMRFYYFPPGVISDGENPPERRHRGNNLNDSAGSIKIVLNLRNGDMTRTYEQTTFLRILTRKETGI
jgi:prepilin-type N-terminal cleavage/methylation domain-containing protein